MKIFQQMESEVRGYCRDYPTVFERASNAEMWDKDDTRYIDFLAGAGTLNYGHNDPDLKAAVIEHLNNDGVLHGLDMHTDAKSEFLTAFRDLILEPRNLEYKLQFTGPTGTNGVEAAIKLARKVTGRHTIVSFTNAFHGMTLGSLAATANSHHRGGAGTELAGVFRMPYEGYFGDTSHSLEIIHKYLTDPSSGLDKPAAFLVETVQGEGGINVASRQWLRGLRGLCQQHDILMIVDDIQMGCGRTGDFFSFEKAEIEPDLVILSKSLGGIGLPMALLLISPDLDIWKPGEHNGTFRGNNLAFVAATEALKKYWEDGRFSQSIHAKGRMVKLALDKISREYDLCGEVRGCGLAWGMDMDEGLAGKVVGESFGRNLIVENCGSGGKTLKVLPPLTIEAELLEEGLGILADSVQAVVSEAAGTQLPAVDTTDLLMAVKTNGRNQ